MKKIVRRLCKASTITDWSFLSQCCQNTSIDFTVWVNSMKTTTRPGRGQCSRKHAGFLNSEGSTQSDWRRSGKQRQHIWKMNAERKSEREENNSQLKKKNQGKRPMLFTYLCSWCRSSEEHRAIGRVVLSHYCTRTRLYIKRVLNMNNCWIEGEREYKHYYVIAWWWPGVFNAHGTVWVMFSWGW